MNNTKTQMAAGGRDAAWQLAQQAHAGQTDKGGNPYINHPLAVAIMVEGNDDAVVVALLHDVVEDTPITLDDLRARGFFGAVVSAVDAVTRRTQERDIDYLARVRSNSLALAVKLADLSHNSDLSRIRNPTPSDIERSKLYLFYRDVLLPYEYFWKRNRLCCTNRQSYSNLPVSLL